MEDVLLDYIKAGAEKTLIEKATDAVTEDLVAKTELVLEDQALGILDLALESGFAEGAVALLGAPFAIVLGIKALKRYRQNAKKTS